MFLTQGVSAQKTDAKNQKTEVSFQQYSSYFEKNNSNLRGETSYLVFKNQTDFDKVFGAAATMDRNTFLPDDAFDSMIVVAAIKRGAWRTYEMPQTNLENGNLYVSYNTTDQAPSSATFSSLLILSVPKGNYKKIVFNENGKDG